MSTDALALLDGAAGVLRGVAPSLPGEGRYAALLATNAVATARRDIAMRERTEAARAALAVEVAAIRAGAHDDDAALHARLVAHAVLRAWVADPASVTPAERSLHVGAGT
jgi:hypothetical protein